MTKKLNIALVTDVLPDKKFAGGQVLDLIVRSVDDALFDVYHIDQSHLADPEVLPRNVTKIETIRFSPLPFTITTHQSRRGIVAHLIVGIIRRICFLLHCNPRPTINFLKKIANLLIAKLYTAKATYNALFKRIRGYAAKILGIAITNKLRFARDAYHTLIKAPLIGLKLGYKLKTRGYDVVWLVLQGEKLAVSYFFLSFMVDKKIILHQWDPIGWWAQNRGYSARTVESLEQLVQILEKKAYLNLVPSHAWQAEQTARGLKSMRIDNFFAGNPAENKLVFEPRLHDCINAVFIGLPYARDELLQIIYKIRDIAVVLEKKLVIHCFGTKPFDVVIAGTDVVNHPHMDRDALIDCIRPFDLALLPYPLDQRFSQASRYSFPSKSKVYLAAGLPILSLSAIDSSPHVFYTKYYPDYYFNLLEPSNLESFVRKTISVLPHDLQVRTAYANELVDAHFSKRTEFEPLHSILKDIRSLNGLAT